MGIFAHLIAKLSVIILINSMKLQIKVGSDLKSIAKFKLKQKAKTSL